MAHTGAVTKAVVPVAGLGTRFLPATKATPKVMMPIVDKPAIQYVVEEAAGAGLEDVLLITGDNQESIAEHFSRAYELEKALSAKGNDRALNAVRAPTQPNLPTVAEAGYPALTIDGLVGLFGPTGMPLDLRQRITADIRAVVDPTIEDRLTITGQLTNLGGPEEFGKSIDEQRAKIADFARQLGINPM